MVNVDDILRKYSGKIEGQIHSQAKKVDYSREYLKFKDEMAPELTRYEKFCKTLGNVIKLKPSAKDEEKIRKQLEIAHVDIEPWQALTLAFISFFSVFVLGLLFSFGILLINGLDLSNFPFLLFFLILIFSISLFYFTYSYPSRLAIQWRLKASSQMVPAILYVVVYMRHTSNMEKAIEFASEHLPYPLGLDFKKVFYDVQIGKFSTLKESLDNYLETWRDYSIEFIEAFHLIESSLFEPDNSRRVHILEKALQVVLDGVYDKMLRFTHEIKSPLTNVYMLGVVLPTLGLALLPLASAMLGGVFKWYHVFILFNLIIPFFVFYLTDNVLMKRPGGYGETELLEKSPLYFKYKSKKPYVNAFLICLPLFILGLLPLIFQFTFLPDLIGMPRDFKLSEIGLGIFGDEKFFNFIETNNGIKGPYGIGALILSLFLPIGIALFIGISFKQKTKEIIKDRDNTKQLEDEFNSSLFQVGNRLGNGVPVELVFGKVLESSRGLKTEDFFRRVHFNIQQSGMSVERAVFDSRQGAILYYPSNLIATSMKILVESSKKGLMIAAISLMSISEYVKNIKKINERLKDLLAEIVSDMKSNMTFLAPLLSGIVVSLSAMIIGILSKIKIEGIGENLFGNLNMLTKIFEINKIIPPYFLQISIGIYIIEIIFILTGTLVVINNGIDKLEKTDKTGKNIIKGITLYFITSLIGIISLSLLVSIVLGGIAE